MANENNKLADFSSIATLPMLGMLATGLAYWIHLENANTIAAVEQRSDAAEAAIVQKVSDNYETKVDHIADVNKITQWNERIAESTKNLENGQNETNIKIQHLSDMLDRNNSVDK